MRAGRGAGRRGVHGGRASVSGMREGGVLARGRGVVVVRQGERRVGRPPVGPSYFPPSVHHLASQARRRSPPLSLPTRACRARPSRYLPSARHPADREPTRVQQLGARAPAVPSGRTAPSHQPAGRPNALRARSPDRRARQAPERQQAQAPLGRRHPSSAGKATLRRRIRPGPPAAGVSLLPSILLVSSVR